MTHFDETTYVFAGLGNPGPQYEMTRHNIGFLVVKALASQMGWHFKEETRFNAYVVKGLIDGANVHLLLPTTYMNASGSAIRRYMDYYKIDPKHLIVVVDDIALAFGQLRLKGMGSAGGHNGLKSVETHLGTSHYMRLRMGIGHPGEQVLADYVLDPFTKQELEQLVAFIDQGVIVLRRMLKESPSRVMNAVNTVSQQVNKGTKKDLTKPRPEG